MVAPRLLAISPSLPAACAAWVERAPALVEAGADALLLRSWSANISDIARWVSALEGLPLLLHARCPGALTLGKPLHLPADAARPPGARAMGQSCHDAAELVAAHARGCAYAVLSPIWPPGSKPGDPRPTLGLGGLKAACAISPLPVLALGGIRSDRVGACLRAGAFGVAGIGGFGQPDDVAEMRAAIDHALGSGASRR